MDLFLLLGAEVNFFHHDHKTLKHLSKATASFHALQLLMKPAGMEPVAAQLMQSKLEMSIVLFLPHLNLALKD